MPKVHYSSLETVLGMATVNISKLKFLFGIALDFTGDLLASFWTPRASCQCPQGVRLESHWQDKNPA